jgi:hypothetical protein
VRDLDGRARGEETAQGGERRRLFELLGARPAVAFGGDAVEVEDVSPFGRGELHEAEPRALRRVVGVERGGLGVEADGRLRGQSFDRLGQALRRRDESVFEFFHQSFEPIR